MPTSYWLPNVRIIDTKFDANQSFCIGISEGKITHLVACQTDSCSVPMGYKSLDVANACVSVGWCDMRAFVPEPGKEYQEDLKSATKAAALGGFTQVALLPNTMPTIEHKEQVTFLKQQSTLVEWLPIAALTCQTEGKEMTQLYDLHTAGAVAFSDGLKTTSHTGVLLRTLHYAQIFDGLIIQLAQDKELTKGVMHEGIVSTKLGMKGIPSVSEEMIIQQNLELLRYTGGKIHFATLSTARSVDLIRQAKAEGLCVTADIAAYQLSFLDEDLHDFNTLLKVFPPFRTAKDKEALIDGLKDGTIDAIVSNHIPQDEEHKKLEFDLAEFGIINFQTAFAAIRTATQQQVDLKELIKKITLHPRQILGIATPKIAVGEPANLTIFNPDEEWALTENMLVSKSKNSPFIHKNLKGKVLGTFRNEFVSFN